MTFYDNLTFTCKMKAKELEVSLAMRGIMFSVRVKVRVMSFRIRYSGLALSRACARNSLGPTPTYCLKYLPKNDCEGKLYWVAISLML